ncbi:uncharacterized protein [Lolium perenne]|uniref:uncharacterized protein n=1 Tax=Lolium perenne TaxID=4522 RepID=UPI0021F695B3|nr:uncharacterized protein LOC127305607 isoform X2 [Lolium perenne]XP_051192070.1 uncharacterized protein LOC127305607 isoform X4 [Lolium perenne]
MEDDAAAVAAAVSKVLSDDDLLAEILVRAGFPTTLVRAAAVCKRWLHHASDKAFLRRFRKLNPPRILGFYTQIFQGDPRFVPMLPQPPELAAAVRIVKGYSFGAPNDGDSLVSHEVLVHDCRNGSVSTALRSTRNHAMRFEELLGFTVGMDSPLCPEKAMAIDPPLSPHHQHPKYRGLGPAGFLILSREEKDGSLSYFFVLLENPTSLDTTSETNFAVHVFMLKDGAWCMLASATTQIDHWREDIRAVLVDNRIYIMATYIEITVLDLTTSSFSTVKLPPGLSDSMISRADDASSVYLVGMKEHQLGIWLHKGDSWSIMGTICLREMCANLMMSDCTVKDVIISPLWIIHVGDNAEFVILQMGRSVFYLDTRCRTLRTLYETPEDELYQVDFSIQPFMMIWPPTFPALKCDPTRNAM